MAGGPLPLMDHPGHRQLVDFLKRISLRLRRPDAIIVISAHWEQSIPTLTAGKYPPIIYDYSGFPLEAYEINYPAAGSPGLAEKIYSLFKSKGIKAQLDRRWGFDHGMFVPLKLMYPNADIPCIQLSLVNGLDPVIHLEIGQALKSLLTENILILGSGFSFHNMKQFTKSSLDQKNIAFDNWLITTLTDPGLNTGEINKRLINWEQAPHARYCHPTEEHLIPLHVCYGIMEKTAEVVFNGEVMGKRATAFLWQP